MRQESTVSFTPLTPHRTPFNLSTAFARIDSSPPPPQPNPPSHHNPLEQNQLPPLRKSPQSLPSTLPQKHWWTPQEDEKLQQLVEEYGARNWKKIASFLEDRTDVQCLHRWQKVLNPALIKGPWVRLVLYRQNKRMNWFCD